MAAWGFFLPAAFLLAAAPRSGAPPADALHKASDILVVNAAIDLLRERPATKE